MNQRILDTVVAVLIRRGLSYLGIAVGGASGITDSDVLQLAGTLVGVALLAGNEVFQARKLHKTAKEQGGIQTPAK